MKINKSDLSSKLGKLKGLISKSEGCVNGILLKDNNLIVSNHEIAIKAKLDIETDESFIIPAPAITMIESLPQGEIEITQKDNLLHIVSGKIKNKYSLIADFFPTLEEIEDAVSEATIDCEEFIAGINSVFYAAASANDTKPTFAGVLLESSNGTLNIVALDGFRSAWYKMPYNDTFKVIVPKITVKRLFDLGVSGNLSFLWNTNSIIFKTEEYEIHSRIINGDYFEYSKIYSNEGMAISIHKKTFLEALQRAVLCAAGIEHKAITFDIDGNQLRIETKQVVSEYEEILTLKGAIESPLKIGVNGKFMIEALKTFESDVLTIIFTNAVSPIIIPDNNLTALVLPVRLKD